MLNCKPGDIARIVAGLPKENWQRLVHVDELLTVVDGRPAGWRATALQSMLCYSRLTGAVEEVPAGTVAHARDEYLRPLHDGDGTDEILRIAGKPNETPLDVVRELNSLRERMR